MRRKPIKCETREIVAQAVVHKMLSDRENEVMEEDRRTSTEQLCDVIMQCGIDAYSLAVGCAIELGDGDGSDERAALIHEIDNAICQSIGEDYALEFLHHLTGWNGYFAKVMAEWRAAA